MATTSVWPVRRNPKAKHSEVKDRLDYIMQEEKTAERYLSAADESVYDFIDVAMESAPEDVTSEHQKIAATLEYATQEVKTKDATHKYVSGINCVPETAFEEFEKTKARYGKTDGRMAYHGYQSFPPGEVTPDLAHELGIRLAEEMWPGFEVVVATHLDREHIHNHFVINSVCMTDGHKFHNGKDDYRKMREISDRLCIENGLSIVEHPVHEGQREKQQSILQLIKADIDDVIMNPKVQDFEDFVFELQRLGYKVDTQKKYLTIVPPGKQKAVRIDRENRLGTEYGIEKITERILSKSQEKEENEYVPADRKIELKAQAPYYSFKLNLRCSYNIYTCILYQKSKKNIPSQYRLSFQARQDLNWINNINSERAYLLATGLKTTTDVTQRYDKQSQLLKELIEERRKLLNKLRRADDENLKEKLADVRQKIKLVNEELKMLTSINTRAQNINNKIVSNYKKAEREDKKRWQKRQM